jgi:hypothetical protein
MTQTIPGMQAKPLRWRGRRLVFLAIGVMFFGGLSYAVIMYMLTDEALRDAVAEADRLDPGWRAADLEAARAPVPDAENAAPLVLTAATAMGATRAVAIGGSVETRLGELSPQLPLDEDLRKEIQAELTKQAKAVELARRLVNYPRGRYSVVWAADGVGTLLPHLQEVRKVAALLVGDAVYRADRGDITGALVSVRAAINAGRSMGDEPTVISQLVRIACQRLAVRALERALAQGSAPEPALRDLEHLLEDEVQQPLQLLMARSDRASIHQFLEVVQAGRFNQAIRASYGLSTSMFGARADDWVDRTKARASHAAYLRFLNEQVEIAKLPPEQQHDRLEKLEIPKAPLPKLLEGLLRGFDHHRLASTCHNSQVGLRCAIVALAAERYRLEHQRWPDKLESLISKHLGAVPTDPYDSQPLRLRAVQNGIVVYSIGPDRQDDGGNLDRTQQGSTGSDMGLRLWDVPQRARP